MESISKIIGQLDDVNGISSEDSLVLENSVSFSNEDLPYTDMRYDISEYRDITQQENLSDLCVMIDENSPKLIEGLKDLVGRKLPGMTFSEYQRLEDSVIIQCTPDSSTVRLLSVEQYKDKIIVPLTVLGRYISWYSTQKLGVIWNKF